ncbi:MAG: DUF1830 domain-containing protein [Crocosphaera sp.]|nr:DUF1830 domain-containing protein [Crocosphaera sp.]
MISVAEKIKKINCIFRNELDKMVIITIESEGIERVIPAFGCLEFKAKADAELKVYTYEFVTMCLSARIHCLELLA